MKKRLLVVVLGVSAFVLLAGFGFGRHHGFDPEKARKFADWRVDDFLDDLEATDAQRAQVHAVKDQLLDHGLKVHADNRAIRGELLAQWDAPKPDGAKVHALVDQRAAAITAFAHHVVDAGLKLHGILDAKQRGAISERIHDRIDER